MKGEFSRDSELRRYYNDDDGHEGGLCCVTIWLDIDRNKHNKRKSKQAAMRVIYHLEFFGTNEGNKRLSKYLWMSDVI